MLMFLIAIGVAAVVLSAGVILVVCMASARQTEKESWSEQPLTAHQPAQPDGRARRITS